MTKKKIILILLLLFIIIPTNFYAIADWQALKTKNFTVFYKLGYEWKAKQSLAILEAYREKVVKLTGNKNIGHIPITIYDAGTISNGFCNPINKNIGIYTYSPSFGFCENWNRMVSVHEYIHMGHLTQTEGISKIMTTIFGSVFAPNLFSPGWIVEGITVYGESQNSHYEGRLNDGFFDDCIMAKAKEKKFPSIFTATYSPFEFPGGGGIYLYGGELFQYLSLKYGEDKFAKVFNTQSSSVFSYPGLLFPFLGIDRSVKKVYGKSFPQLFKEWQKETEKKAKDWQMEGEKITDTGWDISSPLVYQQKLYYIREYPKKTSAFRFFNFAEIVVRDIITQKEKVIVSTNSSFSMALKIKNGKLYYAIKELQKGYNSSPFANFGFVSIIYEKDLLTGKEKVIFKEPIRSFAPLEDNKIIYTKDKKMVLVQKYGYILTKIK
ncbi:MAG: hypothetical protein ABIB46_06030 [bacterium]